MAWHEISCDFYGVKLPFSVGIIRQHCHLFIIFDQLDDISVLKVVQYAFQYKSIELTYTFPISSDQFLTIASAGISYSYITASIK